MDKKNPEGYESCWEFWNCSPELRKKCPVYKAGDGKKCWIYTDNLKIFDWAREGKKIATCRDCPWYQHFFNRRDK